MNASKNSVVAKVSALFACASNKPAYRSFVGKGGAQVVMTDKFERWIRVSKNVSDAVLEKLGTHMGKLHTKTAKAAMQAVAA